MESHQQQQYDMFMSYQDDNFVSHEDGKNRFLCHLSSAVLTAILIT
jgi:hypothetical protein